MDGIDQLVDPVLIGEAHRMPKFVWTAANVLDEGCPVKLPAEVVGDGGTASVDVLTAGRTQSGHPAMLAGR